MKKIITVAVVLLLCLGVGGVGYVIFVLSNKSTVAQKSGSPFGGFRDVTWGDALTKHPKLRKVQSIKVQNIYYDYYSNIDDSLKIGGAELKSIEYIFSDGKALGVSIKFEGDTNFEELKRELSKKYGEANEKKYPGMYSYTWDDASRSGIMMSLIFSDRSKNGEFTMLVFNIGLR